MFCWGLATPLQSRKRQRTTYEGSTAMSGRAVFIAKDQKQVDPAAIPGTRIRGPGRLFADIIEDHRSSQVVHFVVQKRGSTEILFLGQSRSRMEAEFAACAFMADHRRARKAARRSAA